MTVHEVPQENAPERACARCQSAIESGDLRCAVCSLPVPNEPKPLHHETVRILRCNTCGAALSYEVEVLAPRCVFCGSLAEVVTSTDPLEMAQTTLPFLVGPDQARQALLGWLGSLGFFRPSDLVAQATMESLRPLWWAAWVFDARALISWTADSNAGARKAAWAPHAGQTQISFEQVLVSASRGLNPEEAAKLTPFFQLEPSQATPIEPPGAVSEGFEVQRSSARRHIVDTIESVAQSRVVPFIPGSRHRHLKLAVLLEGLRTQRLAMPTYVFAYRYRNKLYRALVHGQDASCVIGTAPYSIIKIILTILGVLIAVFLVISISMALF